MARKSLKQKLKSQLRVAKHQRDSEHHLAGVTINHETQMMQSVSMAHGVMATLINVKNVIGEDHEHFKEISEMAQNRISQCLLALMQMGLTAEEANARILRGH